MQPRISFLCAAVAVIAPSLCAQAPTISLDDALARAAQYGGQVQTANIALGQAREDIVQARAGTLPSLNALNQYIRTQPNGSSSGVFIANNGVNEFIEQGAVHEELLALIRRGEIRRTRAAEAVARARVDVAARGLKATVVQDYYAIVAAARVFRNAQTSVGEAQRFLEITQQLQRAGEAAQADVIKAQINLQTRQRELQEAEVNVEKAKITLGVLIFPDFTSDFAVTDDLQIEMLPMIAEARTQAASSSPEVQAANAGVQEANFGVRVARYGYLPALGLDFFYGFDANKLAYRSLQDGVRYRNLGYAMSATLDIPLWNWGATRSKVKQAELRRDQAQVDLNLAQRNLQGNVATQYAEAQVAFAQLDSLRSSNDLSAESLRLTQLRYQAGEATALEVVDAQSTATQGRNAYDQGLARFRTALDTLRVLMGTL
jgi:outer membrane protein TolC